MERVGVDAQEGVAARAGGTREQRRTSKCTSKTRRVARRNATKGADLQRKLKGLRVECLLDTQEVRDSSSLGPTT